MHTNWSDGSSPLELMAETALAMGHRYVAITIFPRLAVARGLSPERLVAQIERIEAINQQLAPFRVLSGIEVDILEDGALIKIPISSRGSTWSLAAPIPSCGCRPNS